MRTVFRDDHWMLQTQVARFVEQEILPYYAQWEDLGVTPGRCGARPEPTDCSIAPFPRPGAMAVTSAMPPS